MSGTTYFNSQSLDGIKDATLSGNLYANNIIMSSNMSTNSGQGNVYFSGNLVVNGNIFSLGGSVGSGSGTSQGVTYTLPSSYSLVSAGGTQPFANGVSAPNISGFNINLNQFTPQAVQAVTSFGASTGMLKFATGGLYQVQCVLVGDQPVAKVGIGSTTSSTFPPTASPTGNYVYVYNFPLNSSPSEVVTIPLTITDTSKWYYLDAYFSNIAGTPTVLYQTAPPSGSAAGSNYGTYVQVSPFGNYLTSATGVASGLLLNCSSSTTLSAPVTSNTFRLAMTSSNGWTVNGVSTSIAVTSGGNFQINQVGIYEVSLCLNAVGATPVMFGVGSLATDTAPTLQGPYLYQYAPMYTQDPTTTIKLPLNITDTSKYYYIDVIFPGTQATVALSNVSTYVSLRPVGSYVSPSTNPWSQQGTSVYYNGGAVAIGGVTPSLLTETLTINGNTSFVGNVTVTSDVAGSGYVTARRTPAGSLAVSNYVTGSVPLTTTTNLIQGYLSNAATIGTQNSNVSVSLPGTLNSGVLFQNGGQSASFSNCALSNLFVEAWVYRTGNAVSSGQIIFGKTLGLTYDLALFFDIGNPATLKAYLNNTSGTQIGSTTSSGSVGLNTWTHVAFSYNRTGTTTGQPYVFINGTATSGTAVITQPRSQASSNIGIGVDYYTGAYNFQGFIQDVRIMTGSIVPVATFTPQAAPFTTAPTYRTGMDTGYTSNLTLALNSQYFPGASTSPYGPCLTLPGTVGSYYSNVNTAFDTNWKTNGFCLEAWVNYASLANSNVYNAASIPLLIGHYAPTGASTDWGFGATTTGQLAFWYYNGAGQGVTSSTGALVTGQWTHVVVQSNGTNIWLAVNGTFVSGAGTAISGTPVVTAGTALTVGQLNNNTGPNFAIAKARLTFGTSGSPSLGNVYSSGNFTPNPNFATVPAGATVAWSLDSQYPLPTYPSIQDVTQLPLQSSSYGSLPTPVGGVTSNVLGPYTSNTQFDSIRFDGTGYIDYGNAASSVMTSNIWASPWTMEAWVYLTALPGGALYPPIFTRQQIGGGADWAFQISPTGTLFFQTAAQQISGPTLAVGTWYHVAATYDGARCNVYTSYNSSSVGTASVTGADMAYTPSRNFLIAAYPSPTSYYITGNLADVRVSNVARYTGSSYTVPTAPFTTDSSTLLLLKSLGGQVGTTLEVQGRGLNSTSIGAGRNIYSFPPAPMSSYLLDTTSNASVTYGQGKYVASASSEVSTYEAWRAFDKSSTARPGWSSSGGYNSSGAYTGSVTTIDTLGNSYAGEWLQIQVPVSTILSTYSLQTRYDFAPPAGEPLKWWVLGSRDGTNWTLVDSQSGVTWTSASQTRTFTVGSTQAYNYYRTAVNIIGGTGGGLVINEWTLNGTEESLCVTSDSKVGVGIANPQRALEVAGDLVVGGTVSAGNPLMYRNRVINGDMRIDQRGSAATPITASQFSYSVDRWQQEWVVTSGTVTVGQRSLTAAENPYQLGLAYSCRWTVTNGVVMVSGNYILPKQIIEGYNIADLNWGTSFGVPATVSFWFRGNVGGTYCSAVRVRGGGITTYNTNFTAQANTWTYVTYTVPPPPNGSGVANTTNGIGVELYIGNYNVYATTPALNVWTGNFPYQLAPQNTNWWTTPGNYIEFTGVQLEKGTVATPFEFRPYATELQLCQRYYQKSYQYADAAGTVTFNGIIPAIGMNTDAIQGTKFSPDMRTVPSTVTIYSYAGTSGKASVFASAGDTAAAVAGTSSQKGIRYLATSGITIGAGYMYHYIADAEL